MLTLDFLRRTFLVVAVGCFFFLGGAVGLRGQSLGDLVLVETKTHSPIAVLGFGDTFNLSQVGGFVNLRVDYLDGEPGSVQMRLSGPEYIERIENHPPFSVVGDSGGSYLPWSPKPGEYTLVAEAYEADHAQGRLLHSQTYSFNVIDEEDVRKRPLRVINGRGSGMYPPGTPVEIQADTPPRGQRFYRWMGDTEGMRKVRNTTTRLPMPDAEAWVAATYRPSKHNGQVTVGGQLEQWHKVVVDLNGPYASETSLPNPFMDFRYQVAFVGPNQQRLDVPGFFAGDGKGGSAGNTWRAFFRPDQAGQWNYTISLRQGNQVAVDPDDEAGQPLPPYDGTTGTFTVGPSSARVPDFRSPDRGALRNQGGRYPTFANGQPFYYVGVGIPENILAYPGFDNTNLGWALPFKGYEQHYQDGDPRWQNEDGVADKALIGAINHLAEQGGNVIVVRPIDLGSDGNGVFPFISPAEKTRYDLSKLAQWEILFEHAQAKGIYLSVMIDETQSDEDFFPDDGAQGLGSARKLYYRMINAIMGHHNGQKMVISGKAEDSEALHGNPSQAFFKQPSINPYDTLVMFPAGFRSKPEGDSELQQANQRDTPATPLLLGDINLFDYAVQIRRQSANSGAPAIAQLDRPLNIQPAIDGSEYDDALAGIRNQLWSFLMGGGSGLAGYVRAEGARQESDQRIDDFLLRPEALNWSRHARSFFEALPVQQMQSSRALAFSQRAIPTFVFYQPGEIYAIYTGANGGPITLDLSDATGEFTVQWYDPRTGEFLDGTVHSVQGGESVDLGAAPRDPTMDWAALVKRK